MAAQETPGRTGGAAARIGWRGRQEEAAETSFFLLFSFIFSFEREQAGGEENRQMVKSGRIISHNNVHI